ncbi:hypothetical protein PENSPDRAFT_633101 [Peniophora sp. CONT]|nr:hypothetical protein PENSPDRAFT_633101 [Peniophora sp. CONT]
MPEPIIFYDLLRQGPEGQSDSEKCWSPNTLQETLTHLNSYALNIKGLSYKTEWLSFSEVEPKMKELGILPNRDYLLHYTIPTIYDPNTKRIVTDSFAIAKYLDEAYPDTPNLVAPGTASLQAAYMEKVVYPLLQASFRIFCFPVFEGCCMNDADRKYVRESREKWFKKALEDVAPKGEDLTAACKAFGAQLDGVAKHVAANGTDAVFIAGDAPAHIDAAVAAILQCIVKICGTEHELAKTVLEHQWATKHLQAMSKWK